MEIKNTYYAIGLMSGTSLDGLDVTYCRFDLQEDSIRFELLKGETYSFSAEFEQKLKSATALSGLELSFLSNEVAEVFSESVNTFISENKVENLDFIASHGQTIFHQPNKGLTFQIGNGALLAAKTQQKVICDFRSSDVAYGGQGAPLVPKGDMDLFPDYDMWINLGGFSNYSIRKGDSMIASDICAVNVVLNNLSEKLGVSYDKGGELAKSGSIIENLLEELNQLSFYRSSAPKSLGYEWVMSNIFPLLKIHQTDNNTRDILRTCTEHIAYQIGNEIKKKEEVKKVLFSGGGAHNTFLMERISFHSGVNIEIPAKEVVDFKEAIIFAYLGLLRALERPNCQRTVTGAKKDVIGGCIYLP